MLLGPIFQVEMVSIARRRRYTLLRVVYGMLMLLVLWSAYSQVMLFTGGGQAQFSIQTGQILATNFFRMFSWLQMFAILAVGPAMAVGTIATERERRTIEYLFTTDLANHEIVLGKIIARLCLLGQFVLVGLPVLFLFRLLGGISTDLLLGSFLLAGSTAIMLTTFSVCVSVWSPSTRDATTRVYMLLAVWLLLPLIVRMFGFSLISDLYLWYAIASPILDFLDMFNPVYILGIALYEGLNFPVLLKSLALQLMFSGLATLLAIAAVRRVHLRDSTRGATDGKKKFQLPRWYLPLGKSPMIWKEVFSQGASSRLGMIGRIAMMLLLGVVFVGLVTAFAFALIDSRSPTFVGLSFASYFPILFMATMFLSLGILILLAANAAGSITTEKESDCWLSLLATPLTGKEILWGKMCGCFYSQRWAMALLAFGWLLGICLEPDSILAALATLLTLLTTTGFAVNLGLLYSLRSLTTMRAIGATLATLIFCGGGYLFCCCAVMAGGGGGGDDSMALFLAPCIPFLLGVPIASIIVDPAERISSDEIPFYFAYAVGIFGYLCAGIAIFHTQAENFDEITGRSCTMSDDLKSPMA